MTTALRPTLPREAELALALCSEPQRRFVLAFLETADPVHAATTAGYPANKQRQVFQQVAVQKAIRAFYLAAGGDALVSVPWIIERLKLNVDRAMQATPVLDKEGKPVGIFTHEGAVANKGLELLGKYLGIWIDRQKVEHDHTVLILDAFSSDEEIEEAEWTAVPPRKRLVAKTPRKVAQ